MWGRVPSPVRSSEARPFFFGSANQEPTDRNLMILAAIRLRRRAG